MYTYLNIMVLGIEYLNIRPYSYILDSYTSIILKTSLIRRKIYETLSAYGIYSIYSFPDGITAL